MQTCQLDPRKCVALLRSLVEPEGGERIVALHALAEMIHPADIVLPERPALVGGLAEPRQSLGIVVSCMISRAEQRLRSGIALFGFLDPRVCRRL